MEVSALTVDQHLLRQHRSNDLNLVFTVGRHALIAAFPCTHLHCELVALALGGERGDRKLSGILLVVAGILIIF